MPGALDSFAAFTPLHAFTLLVVVAAIGASSWVGRRWAGTARERTLRRAWIAGILAVQSVSIVWFLLPANYDRANSWPLQVCDLMPFVAAWALGTGNRTARALLYFAGFGLTTQAFITPTLTLGPIHLKYWLFWFGHVQIVGSAVYDVVVLGFRPRVADFARAWGVLLAYFAAVFVLDATLGLNYGYVGPSKPGAPTLLDHLGPWPRRLVWMALMAGAALGLLLVVGETLPRLIARRAPARGARTIRRGADEDAGADGRAGR